MRIDHIARLSLVVAIALSWIFGPPATGDCTFVLRDTAQSMNPELAAGVSPSTLFEGSSAGAAVVFTDLANAVASLSGSSAHVDALSYGEDDPVDPYSYFLFSISVASSGSSRAIPGSAIVKESKREVEADIFSVQTRPTTSRNHRASHSKSADENSSPSRLRGPKVCNGNLGLHGVYGSPRVSPAATSNIGAFDSHDFRRGLIYFSIDAPAGGYLPADVLVFDPSLPDPISLFLPASSLGLDATDDIDALAMTSGAGNSTGWYSLARGSGALSSNSWSAADIFEFQLLSGAVSSNSLYMTAESIGFFSSSSSSSDADIDSLSHIDPRMSEGGILRGGIDIDVEWLFGAIPNWYNLVIDGEWFGPFDGSDLLPLVPPLESGDALSVQLFGLGPAGVRFFVQEFLTEPSPIPALLSDLTATIGSGLSIELDWTTSGLDPADVIEVSVDGEIQPDLPPTAVSWTTGSGVSLLPGTIEFRLQRRDMFGVRSDPVSVAIEIESTLQPPERLSVDVIGTTLLISWINSISYTELGFKITGVPEETLPAPYTAAGFQSLSYPVGSSGAFEVQLRGFDGSEASILNTAIASIPEPSSPGFLRGNLNSDTGVDISDAIFGLSALFVPGSALPACEESGDVNNDGGFDISDMIFLLSSLFVPGASQPAAPFPACAPASAPMGCAVPQC